MVQLYLHIGMHKTGSTSIQDALEENRGLLRESGILFPDLGDNQSRVLNRAFGTSEDAAQDTSRVNDIAERLVQQLKENPVDRLVISSEALFHYRARRRDALKSVLDRITDDVRVIVYVREPIAWATSQAQQHLRHGRITLDELASQTATDDGRRGRSVFPRYRAGIEAWMNAYGPGAMDIRPFGSEHFVGGTLMSDFCAALGAPELARKLPDEQRNPSVSYEAILLLDRLMARAGRRSLDDQPELTSALARLPGSKFSLPLELQRRIVKDTAEDVRWLREITNAPLFADRAPESRMPEWNGRTLDALLGLMIKEKPRESAQPWSKILRWPKRLS
ncbi:hypothetical protein [Prosthecomicrobium sp. N25]|uniref:hypothetical protein n=1 Tax=Prosthecomicrobium sp. N25 TaxID=3129254 RepID=UPI003078739C